MSLATGDVPAKIIMRCYDSTIRVANNRVVRISNTVAVEKLDHSHTASGMGKWSILGSSWAVKKNY